MFKLVLTEMKVFARDWWFWLIQVIQIPMVVASIVFLLSNQLYSPFVTEILNFAILWLMTIWLQLNSMHLIWRNDFPIHAWQLSCYRLSLHAFVRLGCFYLVYLLPATFFLFLVLFGAHLPGVLFVEIIVVQAICLQFGCIIGYLLKSSNVLSGLGALFLLPIFLPLNLIPAGANLVGSPDLIQFSIYFTLGVGCLGSVIYMLFFDGVLGKSV